MLPMALLKAKKYMFLNHEFEEVGMETSRIHALRVPPDLSSMKLTAVNVLFGRSLLWVTASSLPLQNDFVSNPRSSGTSESVPVSD